MTADSSAPGADAGGPPSTAAAPAEPLSLLVSPQGGPIAPAEPVPSLALEPATPARSYSQAFSNGGAFRNGTRLNDVFLPTSAAVTNEALTQALDKADFSSSKSPGLDALAYVSDALVGGLGTVPGLSLDPPANPPMKTPDEPETDQDGRVMAYAKLDFPEHDFFIRKLEIVIGRRPPNATAAAAAAQRAQAEQQVDLVPEPEPVKKEEPAAEEDKKPDVESKPNVKPSAADDKTDDIKNAESLLLLHTSPPLLPKRSPPPDVKPPPQTPAKAAPALLDIDVDLGPIRAVSRDHARIFYDYQTSGWMIRVNGRNGVVVEGRWLEKGECVALGERTKIQIAERIFWFVLPNAGPAAGPAPMVGTVDPTAMSLNGAADEGSSEDEEIEDEGPIASGSGYGSYFSEEEEEEAPAWTSKRGSGKMPAKAPRAQFRQGGKGVAAAKTNGKGKAAAKAPKHKPAPKGKGKAGKADEDDEASDAASSSPQPPTGPPKRVRPPPVAPKGAEVGTLQRKPPYTYASLVAQALTALNEPSEEGKTKVKGKGKDEELDGATLSEICEWIKGVYPYFGEGGTGAIRGTDWQSSIRHNLNSDKRFIKTENPAAAGSNIKVTSAMALWTMLESEKPNFNGVEFRKPRPDPPPRPAQTAPQPPPPPRPIQPAPQQPNQQRAVGATPIIVTSKPPPRPAQPAAAQKPSAPAATAPKPPAPAARPQPPAPPKPAPPPAAPPFRIVVAEIPAAARPPVPASALTGDDLASIMQRDPPMVSHNDRLLLNPSIFGHLKPEQVASLEKLGPDQALKILQTYIVQHFKEKMKKAKAAKKKAKLAGGASMSPSASASASPAVGSTLPLPKPVEISPEATPPATATATKRKADDTEDADRPTKTVAVEGADSKPAAAASTTAS